MITKYRCEICSREYSDMAEAMACEARGKPDLSLVPLNVMFQNDLTERYGHITFATKEAYVYQHSHCYCVNLWAARDNGRGDSLGNETCSNGNLFNEFYFRKNMAIKDFEAPHFKRMVQYFVDHDIPARYWDGEKIVDFDASGYVKNEYVKAQEDFAKAAREADETGKPVLIAMQKEPDIKPVTDDTLYECRYAMYLHHKGIKSIVKGNGIVDAIKNRNQNAILVSITDTDGTEYVCNEHDLPVNNEFGYYWTDKKRGNVLYDEYDDKEVYPSAKKETTEEERDAEIKEEHGIAIKKQHPQCRDSRELPYKIPHTYGIGVKFKDENGKEYETTLRNEKRRVTLRVTTWRGVSMNAIHYYGRITVYSPDLKYEKDGEESYLSICGYFDRHKPKECLDFDIEMVRELTQEEIDKFPERFEGYSVGDKTNCFYTKEDVIGCGKAVFAERFEGDWKFEIDD